MANKHICCLKPRRCSVCKIQMRYSSDTLCVRSLVRLSSWKYLLLPHWTGKPVCMGGEPCCGRCIVLWRVKEEQQTHFMNYWKNGPGKGKVCVASLVGWMWMFHSIQFQAKYREKSTYNLHRKHTECDTHSHLVASVSLGAAVCCFSGDVVNHTWRCYFTKPHFVLSLGLNIHTEHSQGP